jgi:hypothetical protein
LLWNVRTGQHLEGTMTICLWHWRCTHLCLAFFKCFNFHACSKNICWTGSKTFQNAKLWASQRFMKTWSGYYISASKCLWLNGLNRVKKIVFSKLENFFSIRAIFFNWCEKITRFYCNITNHVLTCTPSMLLGDRRKRKLWTGVCYEVLLVGKLSVQFRPNTRVRSKMVSYERNLTTQIHMGTQ